jgi:hypothetical protein
MTEKKLQQMKAIRWDEDDWEMLATLAERVGLSRSAFIKQAALGEAAQVLAGAAPQYVSGPKASTHTGGANTFSEAKLRQKRLPEEGGAGGPTARGTPQSKAKGVTTDEQAPAKKRRAV